MAIRFKRQSESSLKSTASIRRRYCLIDAGVVIISGTDGTTLYASPGLRRLPIPQDETHGCKTLDQAVALVLREMGERAKCIVSLGNQTLSAKKHELDGTTPRLILLEISSLILRNASSTRSARWPAAVLDASADGIFAMDGNGIIIYVNRSWERLTGLKAPDAVGRPGQDLVKEGYFQHSLFPRILETSEPCTVMNETKAGYTVLSTGMPVWDSNGNVEAVVVNVRDVTELSRLRKELEEAYLLAEQYAADLKALTEIASGEDLIFHSKPMWQIKESIEQVAQTDCTVLLTGDTGVGKGAIARYIHTKSSRNAGPYITLNCGAIPEALFEAECFGYESGAFTGASVHGKPGIIELANTGTLFLDEVGEIPLSFQVKLLHAIEERWVVRVGGVEPVPLDIRIIAATNRNLKEAVRLGAFREDSYYRLDVVSLEIPRLRDRIEDIPALSAQFLLFFNHRYSLQKQFHPKTVEALCHWNWPGNIRELRNVVERTVITSQENIIRVDDLPEPIRVHIGRNVPRPRSSAYTTRATSETWKGLSLSQAMEEFEKELLSTALRFAGSMRKAAKQLDIHPSTISRKVQKYGLDVPASGSDAAPSSHATPRSDLPRPSIK